MFYLMTVEQGAQYLAWCESQTRPSQESRECRSGFDVQAQKAPCATGPIEA